MTVGWDVCVEDLTSLQVSIVDLENRHKEGQWTIASISRAKYLSSRRNDILQRALCLQAECDIQLAVLECRVTNTLKPMGRLPIEILLLIFKIAISFKISTPETLMRVCNQWRTLVRGEICAPLWTLCPVHAALTSTDQQRSIARLGTILELSRNQGLHLDFSAEPDCSSTAFTLPKSMIHKHISRTESVIVTDREGDECPWLPIRQSTPILRKLELAFELSLPAQILTQKAPLLTQARISVSETTPVAQVESLLDNLLSCGNITHLSLSVHTPGTPIAKGLNSFTELVYLNWFNLGGITQSLDDEETPIVCLSRLETLILTGCEPCMTLRGISAPLIRNLVIHADSEFEEEGSGSTAMKGWFEQSQPAFPALELLSIPFNPDWGASFVAKILHAHCCLQQVELKYTAEQYSSQIGIFLDQFVSLIASEETPKSRYENHRIYLSYDPSGHETLVPTVVDSHAPNISNSIRALATMQSALWPNQPHTKIGLPHDVIQLSSSFLELAEESSTMFGYRGTLEIPGPWPELSNTGPEFMDDGGSDDEE